MFPGFPTMPRRTRRVAGSSWRSCFADWACNPMLCLVHLFRYYHSSHSSVPDLNLIDLYVRAAMVQQLQHHFGTIPRAFFGSTPPHTCPHRVARFV